MLAIRQDQWRSLSALMLKQFEDKMVLHLKSTFTEDVEKMGETDLRSLIRKGVSTAAAYKIESEADVQRYLELMLWLGADFDVNPPTAWTQEILRREDIWPWEKLDEIENHAALLRKGEA